MEDKAERCLALMFAENLAQISKKSQASCDSKIIAKPFQCSSSDQGEANSQIQLFNISKNILADFENYFLEVRTNSGYSPIKRNGILIDFKMPYPIYLCGIKGENCETYCNYSNDNLSRVFCRVWTGR